MDVINQFIDSLIANEEIIPFSIILFGAFLIGILFGWILRRGTVKRLKKELEKKGEQIIDLQGQFNAATQKLALQETEIQKIKQLAEEDARKIEIMEGENAKLQKTVYHLNSEYDKLKSSGHSFESTFDDLNNQLIGYKSQVEQLQEQLDEAIAAKIYAERKLESIANDSTVEPSPDTNIKTEEQPPVVLEYDVEETTERTGAQNERLQALEAKLDQLFKVNETLTEEIEKLKATPSANQIQPADKIIPPAVTEKNILATNEEFIPEDGSDLSFQEPFTPKNGQSTDTDVLVSPPTNPPSEVSEDPIVKKIDPEVAIEKDNLTLIEGIGPFIERKLNENGIYTYEQISEFDDPKIEEVTKAIQFFEGRIKKDDWVGQAKSLFQIKMQNPTAFDISPQDSEIFSQAPDPSDDLTIIEGIGPKIEQLLNDAGFINISDLANASTVHLQEVLNNAGDAYKMHDPTTWPKQARLAVNGDWELLKDYQDQLKGGKEV